MNRPVIVTQEEKHFVATDYGTGIASQGDNMQEALNNLKEALELYYEDHEKEAEIYPTFLTMMEVQ